MSKRHLRKLALIFASLLVIVTLASAAFWIFLARTPLVTAPETKPDRIIITNVRVIDVVEGRALEGMDVIIEGESIFAVETHDASRKLAAGELSIDGEGRSLMPGLIDAHCHLRGTSAAPWETELPDIDLNMERLLFSGVTRVFDPGGPVPGIFELREEVNSGRRLGPWIHAAGPVFTAPGGHPGPMLEDLMPFGVAQYLKTKMIREPGDAQEVEAQLDELAPFEPDFVKIVVDRIPETAPRIDEGVASALVAGAKRRNVRAVAHVGRAEDAELAARAGVSAWIHGIYKEPLTDEGARRLAESSVPMIPTMVVFKSYAELGQDIFEATELERQIVPAAQLESYRIRPDDYALSDDSLAYLEMLRREQANAPRNVERLYEAGVVMMTGSDAQPGVIHGPSLHREMALLHEAGLPAAEVLRAATLNPARFLSGQNDPPFGIVARGKRADLVLVRGNPLDEPSAVSRIDEIFLGGVRLDRHPLRQRGVH